MLPTDSQARKDIPIASGVLDYFPAALAELAKLSKAGNDKHNPGQPLHWSRGKSNDHADTLIRHFLERGTVDQDTGFLHDVMMAWRALAILQLALEERGAPIARGAVNSTDTDMGPNPYLEPWREGTVWQTGKPIRIRTIPLPKCDHDWEITSGTDYTTYTCTRCKEEI